MKSRILSVSLGLMVIAVAGLESVGARAQTPHDYGCGNPQQTLGVRPCTEADYARVRAERAGTRTTAPATRTAAPVGGGEALLPGAAFVAIQPGTFQMGDGDLHEVTLTQGFEMQTTEVTQAQWQAVMGNNPSSFPGENRPVERVSYDDVQAFLSRLNEQTVAGYRYRLPTEAEWEYAARAGTQTAYSFGDDASLLGRFAVFLGNSGNQTAEVATREANAWGLYDMHGNVWEWVNDWYTASLGSTPVADPRGLASGSNRVLRGGSWFSVAQYLRVGFRFIIAPSYRDFDLGFRLVRTNP